MNKEPVMFQKYYLGDRKHYFFTRPDRNDMQLPEKEQLGLIRVILSDTRINKSNKLHIPPPKINELYNEGLNGRTVQQLISYFEARIIIDDQQSKQSK
jgi:hypothetical protein